MNGVGQDFATNCTTKRGRKPVLRDRQNKLPAEEWIDKLAPKVAEIQDALKAIPPQEVAWRSGATLQGDQLHLDMLFQPYEIDASSYVVTLSQSKDRQVSSFMQSLVLTYLQTADGAPSADRWISFRELPNGGFYHRAFQGYAPDRLTKRWGLDLDRFVAACCSVGGSRLDIGDAGFVFRVLPRIDMGAVYWLGDEDFPSRASMLFDANAHHYMVTDGLAILGSQLVGRILAAGPADA
jgi:hypothetical protein